MIELEDREHLFPGVAGGRLFLNHCGIAPLTGPAARAFAAYAEQGVSVGPDVYRLWWREMQRTRALVAELIGARQPSEIAFMRNTTMGIATVANGLRLKPGDRVVGFEGDYPANVYPWRRLESRGAEYVLAPAPNGLPDLEAFERIVRAGRTRAVAVSSACFWSGARAPLAEISRITHDAGAVLFVDAIQTLGAFALDVKALDIDFLAAGAHKWLMSGQGVGFLYVNAERLDDLDVTMVGADSVAPAVPFLDYHGRLSKDAGRFEEGTLPTANLLALGASLELYLRLGLDRIEAQVRANADILAAGLVERGYELVAPRGEDTSSGIVASRHPRHAPNDVVAAFAGQGITCIEREGYLRMAPHFYQTEEEMRRVVEALP